MAWPKGKKREQEPPQEAEIIKGDVSPGKPEENKLSMESLNPELREYFEEYHKNFSPDTFTERGVFEAFVCNILMGILIEQMRIRKSIEKANEE